MILVYTGKGKGKTTAAIGQALRALGAGLRVAFGQFMKRDGQAGEQKILAHLLGKRFLASGAGFFRHENEREKHRKPARALLHWADSLLNEGLDMLILDEALYTLQAQLLSKDELEALLAHAEQTDCHVVLTGRGLPEWLEQKADFISVVTSLKHPYDAGIPARKGLEF